MREQSWKKNTYAFMSSQFISLFGSSLVQFAITWHITRSTGSGMAMTISILCGFLPTLLISPFAGVWADRYNRKTLIMLSDAIIAISTLILACFMMAGYEALWLIYLISAVRGFGGAVQTPTVNAMLPGLVPEEHLTRVNGIQGSTQALFSIFSPVLAGVLLGFTNSMISILFIDVATAALAIIVMLRYLTIPAREKAPEAKKTGYFEEIKQGFTYIATHRYLLHMFIFAPLIYIAIAPVAFLTPLQVVRTYGSEVWRLTAAELVFASGMLVGGLLISIWNGFRNRAHTVSLAVFVMGLSTATLGAKLPFLPYLSVLLLTGLSLPFFNTPSLVMLQEKVDAGYTGRVMSVLSIIQSSMMPLGMLIFGPLADTVPIEWMLIITGACISLGGGLLLFDRTWIAAGVPKSALKTTEP